MPEWASEGKADVVVKAPIEDDDRYKMILNKAAKSWHGMADPVDRHLSAFVNIDPVFLDQGKLGSGEASKTLLDKAGEDIEARIAHQEFEQNAVGRAEPIPGPEGAESS